VLKDTLEESMQRESIETAEEMAPYPAYQQGDVELATPSYLVLHAVSALIHAVNCTLAGQCDDARQYVGAAFDSLDSIRVTYKNGSKPTSVMIVDRCRGGLAPWQVRRVSSHIEMHLSETIRCEDLAILVRLSLSHFMRAFRDSFGCPPHAYLVKRRMELAQRLMLTTDTALGCIALECGLADQSHLSRLFQKFVGESPAAWRRARVMPSQAVSRVLPHST
jgi:AraC-like DNA-binding protein